VWNEKRVGTRIEFEMNKRDFERTKHQQMEMMVMGQNICQEKSGEKIWKNPVCKKYLLMLSLCFHIVMPPIHHVGRSSTNNPKRHRSTRPSTHTLARTRTRQNAGTARATATRGVVRRRARPPCARARESP
jgi:hypothetical protein